MYKMKYCLRFSFLATQENQCVNYFLLCTDTMTGTWRIECATVFSPHSPRLWWRDSWDSLGPAQRPPRPLTDRYGDYGRASIIQTLVTRAGTPRACRQGPHHLFMFEMCWLIQGEAARKMQRGALRKRPAPHDQGTWWLLTDRGVGSGSPEGRAGHQPWAFPVVYSFLFNLCWPHELRTTLTTALCYKTTDI